MGARYHREMRLLMAKEAAACLGVTLSKFWRMVNDGRFPQPVNFGERFYRWRASDVEKYLEENPRSD